MSFISLPSQTFASVLAQEYGTVAAPVATIDETTPGGNFLLSPITVPAGFLLENYLLIESNFLRRALAFAPVAITAIWGISANPALSNQPICNISMAANTSQTWRAYGCAWGSGGILGTTSFQAPGTQASNGAVDRPADPSVELYLMPRVTLGLAFGDIVDLIYYRITAYRRV